MSTEKRRKEDKVRLGRRKADQGFVGRVDVFLESKVSTVLGWCWKSGLLLFLISLIIQNLAFQKENSEKLVETKTDLKILTESSTRLVGVVEDNKKKIGVMERKLSILRTSSATNKTDIHYLRRDVDNLLKEDEKPWLSRSNN